MLTALPGNEEEEKLLPPLAEKPIQKETAETKRTGSVGISVFMRYISAGGCGVFGLTCLFIIFGTTSAIILMSNWWLGRWSNAERIRYSSTNSTSNCSTTNVSAIATMSDSEWFNKRDHYFYTLLSM